MAFWKRSCGLLVLLWVCSGAAWAEVSPDTPNRCADERGKHILWENDLFAGKLFGKSDKWYTNGVKFYTSYEKECVSSRLPGFLQDQIEGLRDIQSNGEKTYTIQTGNVYGQLMFTPKNLTIAAPQPMDRFWGGWLYMGIVAQRQPYVQEKTKRGELDKSELETLELDFGVTGPPSAAEQVQRGIHAISNSTMPQGWGNQIGAEPGIQLNYVRIMRVWKHKGNGDLPHMDFSWHYGGAVGTLFDYVNGGATIRVGSKLSDEAPNVIESPSIGQFKKTSSAAYFLARLDMKGVAHNTFIDGSLLRRDPYTSYLSSKAIIPQITFGGVLEWEHNDGGRQDGTRLSLLFHRRGSEFRSPAGPGAIFNFATLNVEWDL